MLLIDFKREFDQVKRNELMGKIEAKGADSDLVRWTGSFIVK